MDIDLAAPDDADAISAVVLPLTRKYIAHEFPEAARRILLASMSPGRIRSHIEGGYRYHLARVDGRVVGVVAVRDNSHLYHLFVVESHQRRGIARKLWERALEDCRVDDGAAEITVNSSRFAVPVYERLGFVALDGPRETGGVTYVPMKLTVPQ